MTDFKKLFGANPTQHVTVGELTLVKFNEEASMTERHTTAEVTDDRHDVKIKFSPDTFKNHGAPVMVYTMAGLGFHPHLMGSFGTFAFLTPQHVYIIDGDLVGHPPESSTEYHYTFNFGKALNNKGWAIRPGWRFAVQAAVVYADGTIHLTDWDFLEVV